MKKQIILSILISTLICFFQTSCGKMPPPEEPGYFWDYGNFPTDKKTLIQNRNWKLTEGTITPALNGLTDWFSAYDSCTQDDLYIFSAFDSFSLHESATKCDPSAPQIVTGYWKYHSLPESVHIKLPLSDTIKLLLNYTDGFLLSASSTETIAGINYTRNWLFTKQ